MVAHGAVFMPEFDDAAVELDRIQHFWSGEFPRIAVAQPVVRMLDLLAVFDLLVEHAVFVADAVAVARQFKRRHRVEEAGGEAPKPAVAETGIELDFVDFLNVLSEFVERFLEFLAQPEIQYRIAEGASDQEFERQVVNPLGVRAVVRLHGRHPALDHAVTRGACGDFVPVAGRGECGVFADRVRQVGGHRFADGFGVFDAPFAAVLCRPLVLHDSPSVLSALHRWRFRFRPERFLPVLSAYSRSQRDVMKSGGKQAWHGCAKRTDGVMMKGIPHGWRSP